MGKVVLDRNIINTSVMNDFEEYFQILEDSRTTIKNLRDSLPSSFSYRTYVNNLDSKIQNFKNQIVKVEEIIYEKLNKSNEIESKAAEKNSEIARLLASIINVEEGTTGAVNATSNSSGVGEFITSAAFSVSSVVQDFVGDVKEKVKETGSKISTGYESAKTWVSEKTQVATGWLSESIDSLKKSTSNLIEKTGAKVASAVSMAKEVLEPLGEKILNGILRTFASVGNFVISIVKGLISLIEALGDLFLILGAVVDTVVTGIIDIITGIKTGNWTWEATTAIWDTARAMISYNWTNQLANMFYNTKAGKTLDIYAFTPFKSDGMACQVGEGIGYIAGIIALTVGTCGIGAAVSGGAAAGATAASVSSTALATVSVGSMSATITTGSVVSASIAAAAGIGKNTSAAWNDGAATINGLLYGTAKGLYEGFEMGLGYVIGGLKVVKGSGVVAQAINSASHVVLDTADGASGAIVDPLFSMIYSPNAKNLQDIMRFVNYDKNGNMINDKTWDDLSFGEKYNAIFQYKGGWNTVATQALMAGGTSLLSEIPDIVKIGKAANLANEINSSGITAETAKKVSKLKAEALAAFIEQVNDKDLSLYLKNLQPKEIAAITASLQAGNMAEELNKVYNNIDDETIEYILENNLINFDGNIPENVKSKMYEKTNKEEISMFEKNNIYDGYYGVDQDATHKYVNYELEKGVIAEEDIMQFASYINMIDDKVPMEHAIEIATAMSKGDMWLSFDQYEQYSDYLGSYLMNGKNVGPTKAANIVGNSFKRYEAEPYVVLKDKLVSYGMPPDEAVKTLDMINTTGVCSYAGVANAIVDIYKDSPELFKRDFGFDLYTTINGKQTINSSELLVDMYTYINSDACGGSLFNYNDGNISVNHAYTKKQIYLSSSEGYNEVPIASYILSKNNDITIGFNQYSSADIPQNELKETIAQSLADQKHLGIGIYKTENGEIRFIDQNGDVYLSTSNWDEGDAHAVYITGMTEEGIIVSSWGQRLLIPFEDLNDNYYVREIVLEGLE